MRHAHSTPWFCVLLFAVLIGGCEGLWGGEQDSWIEPTFNPRNLDEDEFIYATNSNGSMEVFFYKEESFEGGPMTTQVGFDDAWVDDTSIAEVRDKTFGDDNEDDRIYVHFKSAGDTTLHVDPEHGPDASYEVRVREPVELRIPTKEEGCVRLDKPFVVGQDVPFEWSIHDAQGNLLSGAPIEPVFEITPEGILDDEGDAQFAGDAHIKSLIDDTEAMFRVVEWADITGFDVRVKALHEEYASYVERGQLPEAQEVMIFTKPLIDGDPICYTPIGFLGERVEYTDTSSNPDTCSVSSYDSGSVFGLDPGLCKVEFNAPDVRGGQGWSTSFEFEIIDLDDGGSNP